MIPLDDRDPRPRRAWEQILGLAIVVVCVLYVCAALRWQLWFRNTTTNGGDMGAHVWWPAYLRDHWFGRLRLSGWSPDWYAGFPVGQFYFPFPAVMIVALEQLPFVSYNVAFKLVSVSGAVLLPIAAYTFGRSLKFPWPAAPLFAVAATRFLFEVRIGLESPGAAGWTIYGGNLASLLAGEFSYTLALALSLFFMAALARSLDTGRRGWLPAVLLAATVTSHIVIAVFAAAGGLIVWLVRRPRRTVALATAVGLTGALLSALWWLPMLAAQTYTTSMRYEKKTAYTSFLFGIPVGGADTNLPRPFWLWFLVLAAVVLGAWWQRAATLCLGLMATVFGLLFWLWPADHHVWNTRFLPLYYLCVGFLAALGAAELARLAGFGLVGLRNLVVDGPGAGAQARALGLDDPDDEGRTLPAGPPPPPPPLEFAPPPPPVEVAVLAEADGASHDLAGAAEEAAARAARRERAAPRWFAAGTAAVTVLVSLISLLWIYTPTPLQGVTLPGTSWRFPGAHDNRWVVTSWANWNYTGYEDQPAYAEFSKIMEVAGKLPPGRLLWEPSAGDPDFIDRYGTSLALELIPYFTKGRIGSMEGLYFEAAATTPYHFLTVAEVSKRASNPVRGLVYGNLDTNFDRGVRHMQMLGVRYFMAWSPEAVAKAEANPNLKLVAQVPPISKQAMIDYFGTEKAGLWNGWRIYEVAGSDLVVGLNRLPVVARNLRGGTTSQCFEEAADPAAGQREANINGWECVATPWFNAADPSTPLFAADGPSNWPRVDAGWQVCPDEPRKAAGRPCSGPYRKLVNAPTTPLPPVQVSQIESGVDRISFRVDQIGRPVLVRASYFPNWQVSGARGPYRVAPNFMVVVPTEREVTLTYGLTPADWGARFAFLAGLVGIGLLVAWSRRTARAAAASAAAGSAGAAGGSPELAELVAASPEAVSEPDPVVDPGPPAGPEPPDAPVPVESPEPGAAPATPPGPGEGDG